MLTSDADLYAQVTTSLTELIRRALSRASTEQSAPSFGADRSDEVITESLTLARQLRDIRARFEEVATGVMLPGNTPEKAV